MKLNKGGLKLGGLYTGFFLLMAWGSYTGEPGAFFAQLAVLPVLVPLSWLHLMESMPPDSWMNSVWFLFPFCLVIVYFIGWAISAIINFKDPSAPVADDPPDWHKR